MGKEGEIFLKSDSKLPDKADLIHPLKREEQWAYTGPAQGEKIKKRQYSDYDFSKSFP